MSTANENRFHGVQRKRGASRKKPFEAWFKYRGKQISLGCYEHESNAAWNRDYAYYLLHGCDPLRDWPTDSMPNFFPARNEEGSPGVVQRILFTEVGLCMHHINSRHAEYMEACGPKWLGKDPKKDPMRERWNEDGIRIKIHSV